MYRSVVPNRGSTELTGRHQSVTISYDAKLSSAPPIVHDAVAMTSQGVLATRVFVVVVVQIWLVGVGRSQVMTLG